MGVPKPGDILNNQRVITLAKISSDYDGHYSSHIRSEDRRF